MPSAEHEFLSDSALNILQQTSRSGLYAYKEGSRKLFDFSCDLKRDWWKVVSGQTLWTHNRDGIDKDIRTLITEPDVGAAIYIAKHTTANVTRVAEVAGSYRQCMREQLAHLRVFWVPADFDADDEKSRETTYSRLQEEITRDLLLQVVLGGLSADDLIRIASSLRAGYPLAILSHIASQGYQSNTKIAQVLKIKDAATVREEMQRLFITGMLKSEELTGGEYEISDKGKAALDFCARLKDHLFGVTPMGPEFTYVARLLSVDLDFINSVLRDDILSLEDSTVSRALFDTKNPTALLVDHIYAAQMEQQVAWPEPHFSLPTA